MILYLETNFLAGFAVGRDAYAEALLGIQRGNLRVAIPAVCLMEAWSVYEDERRRRQAFENTLENQISQLHRDLTSIHADALRRHLQEARTENRSLLNAVRDRLRDVQEKLSGRQAGFFAVELLPLMEAVLAQDIALGPTKDPTDNLILAIIMEHARRNQDEERVFLSGNTRDFGRPEIRALLSDAGVSEYFARTDAFLGWFESR